MGLASSAIGTVIADNWFPVAWDRYNGSIAEKAEPFTMYMLSVRTALSLVAVAILLAAATNTRTHAADSRKPQYAPQAFSTALKPRKAPAYYIDQAQKYWNNMDTRFDQSVTPNYSPLTARWEWPPWGFLTGYGRDNMILTTRAFYDSANWTRDAKPRAATDPPPAGSTVPERDCRFFAVQPFARCVAIMVYPRGPCPIYEEFTFNDDGEMTFIEAWTDHPGMRPNKDPKDRWAEGPDVQRISTHIPGLGNPKGLIDLNADWMRAAAGRDPLVADFVERARDLRAAAERQRKIDGPDYFERGCLWSPSGPAAGNTSGTTSSGAVHEP